jgi:hypothetical protein
VTRTRSSAVAALAGAIAIAGCGGGSSKPSDTVQRVYRVPTAGQTTPEDVPVNPAPSTTTATATTPAPTSTQPQESPGEGNGTGGGGGGGGGTEPARTELQFTGTTAGITPKSAGVAAYISVKVSLVSKDGSTHNLAIAGRRAQVGGSRKSASFTLPGLRPGNSYRGTADGHVVVINATSEPGP